MYAVFDLGTGKRRRAALSKIEAASADYQRKLHRTGRDGMVVFEPAKEG